MTNPNKTCNSLIDKTKGYLDSMAAPKGNQHNLKGRVMSAHLKARLDERKLWPVLMDALLEKALSGDVPAIKEVFDRIDGKAPQDINLGGQNGNPVEAVTRIELVPLDGSSTDRNT